MILVVLSNSVYSVIFLFSQNQLSLSPLCCSSRSCTETFTMTSRVAIAYFFIVICLNVWGHNLPFTYLCICFLINKLNTILLSSCQSVDCSQYSQRLCKYYYICSWITKHISASSQLFHSRKNKSCTFQSNL